MSYLLHGQNPVGLDERVAQLRSQLDPSGLGTTVIDVQSSSIQEISSACQSMPFFGGSRVVVLLQPIAKPKRNGQTGSSLPEDANSSTEQTGEQSTDDADENVGRVSWSELSDVLKSVPPSTEMILRHDGSLSATHFLMKAIKSLGWRIEPSPALRSQDLLQWLGQRVSERGGSIDQHASVALLNRLFPQSWNVESRFANGTPDPRLLATEVDKLIVASNDGKITRNLVEDLVEDREGFTAFKLNDVTFGGNASGALSELSDVLDAGQHPEMLMGQIVGQSVGLSASQSVGEFGAKEVARVSGMTEGRLGMLQKKSGTLSPTTQQRIAESIREAGATLRSSESNAPAVITPLVAEIAEAVRASALERRRG